MSNLIKKIQGWKNSEIVTNAIDGYGDNLIIYQDGNTYTCYIEDQVIDGMFCCDDEFNFCNGDEDNEGGPENATLSDKLTKKLDSISRCWLCEFDHCCSITDEDDDRDQALINLIQCASVVLGYCKALSDKQNRENDYGYNVVLPEYVNDRIIYFNKLYKENVISFSCAMEMILAYDEDQCIDDFMIGCDKPWLPVTDAFKKWRDKCKSEIEQQVAFRLLYGFNDNDLIQIKDKEFDPNARFI